MKILIPPPPPRATKKKKPKVCNLYKGKLHLPTCGLTCFNSAHPWFKRYYLTHMRWSPLNRHYPPLPFPLENPLYYISQNQNPNKTLKRRTSSLLLSTFEFLKIPKPIIPFSLHLDCPSEFWTLASKEVYWSLGFFVYFFKVLFGCFDNIGKKRKFENLGI